MVAMTGILACQGSDFPPFMRAWVLYAHDGRELVQVRLVHRIDRRPQGGDEDSDDGGDDYSDEYGGEEK